MNFRSFVQSFDQGFRWRNNRTQNNHSVPKKYFQQVMPWPGFEPGLSRPQREVLTTIRSRLCILNWKLLWQNFDCISSVGYTMCYNSIQLSRFLTTEIPDPDQWSNYWVTLAQFDSLWNILAHIGTVWLTLQQSGSLWNSLAHFATVWLTLEQFGSHWNIFAHIGTVLLTL